MCWFLSELSWWQSSAWPKVTLKNGIGDSRGTECSERAIQWWTRKETSIHYWYLCQWQRENVECWEFAAFEVKLERNSPEMSPLSILSPCHLCYLRWDLISYEMLMNPSVLVSIVWWHGYKTSVPSLTGLDLWATWQAACTCLFCLWLTLPLGQGSAPRLRPGENMLINKVASYWLSVISTVFSSIPFPLLIISSSLEVESQANMYLRQCSHCGP